MGRDRESFLEGNEGAVSVFVPRDVDVRSALFGQDNKENLCFFVDYAAESLQRSPLPVGYPRSPLQDITDVLSSLNQSTEADKCGGYMRKMNQRRIQKEPSLVQLYLPFVDSEATSSGQFTVMESTEVCRSGSIDFAQPQFPGSLVRSEIPKRSSESSSLNLVTKRESDKEVVDQEHVAGRSQQAKRIVARRAPSFDSCAELTSPGHQRSKRRKPFAKLIPGQNVPRFRSATSTGIFNQVSTTPSVWILKTKEQDVYA